MFRLNIGLSLTAVFLALTLPIQSSKAGPTEIKAVASPTPIPYFRSGEWDIGVSGQYTATQTQANQDRYLGVDHAFGGTADGEYFFNEYFGAGISFSGLSVNNSSSLEGGFLGGPLPQTIAATGTSGFVGDVAVRGVARYPIGQFAPYAFVNLGAIFNGGNSTLTAPNGLTGQQLKFQAIEHDVKMLAAPGAGVEFRITPNIGLFVEGEFDKIDRPQSNAWSVKSGVRIALGGK